MATLTLGQFLPLWKSPHLWTWNQMQIGGLRATDQENEQNAKQEENKDIMVLTRHLCVLSITVASPSLPRYHRFTSTFQISYEFLFWLTVICNHEGQRIQVIVILHHGQKLQCQVGVTVLRYQCQILLLFFFLYRGGNWDTVCDGVQGRLPQNGMWIIWAEGNQGLINVIFKSFYLLLNWLKEFRKGPCTWKRAIAKDFFL